MQQASIPAAASTTNDASERTGTPARLALGLMVLSGFSALGYQIVWTQQNALWLGHEAAAVLAVVAAFFGGLALGALALGPRIDRSPRPSRWYASCELVIGIWSLVLALSMGPITRHLVDVIGPQPSPAWHWLVAFLGAFVLLLPATAAMGATLPAMERVAARLQLRGVGIASLYAGNTLGAILGVATTAFWLIPAAGLTMTACACAVANALCAVLALRLFERPDMVAAEAPQRSRRMLATMAITGLLGIGYEVVVVRVLSQVAENTIYTFAIVLIVYLAGTAMGAALYDRFGKRASASATDGLLRTVTLCCLGGVLALGWCEDIDSAVRTVFGGIAGALAGEAAIAAAAFLLPTIAMGALFSHLATCARAAGVSFGRALGFNTLGAAIAPFLFGVIAMPAIGAKHALIVVAAGYALLSSARGWRSMHAWATAVATLAVAALAPSLVIVDVPERGRLVSFKEGAMATVSVVEDGHGVATLHIDNRQQEGSSATLVADARQALLPILLHPAPARALFLGLGTGVTAWSAARDRALRVDAVELLPEVAEASHHFTDRQSSDGAQPRPHVMIADARRYVRAARAQYDVIVSDNFHPARSGSGSLYTVEHFAAVRERLTPGGIFCQWLPLHQMDLHTLRSIVRTFIEAYPGGWGLLATNSLDTPVVGLIGRNDAHGFDVPALRRRLDDVARAQPLADFGITDDLSLLGAFIASPASLARFAGDAPINTDDLPVVAYRAPRATYEPRSSPRDRLLALLGEMSITPDALLAAPHDAPWNARLAAYWAARDRFIAVGRGVTPTADVRRMLAQVGTPLLDVLRVSPDFRPAYDPLLRMGIALARIDGHAALDLLTTLQRIQPRRAEAGEALRAFPAPAR